MSERMGAVEAVELYGQLVPAVGDVTPPEGVEPLYGPATPVNVNGREMTLEQALQFEALCPVDDTIRLNAFRRLRKMAGMLAAAGSLREEHQYLLTLEVE